MAKESHEQPGDDSRDNISKVEGNFNINEQADPGIGGLERKPAANYREEEKKAREEIEKQSIRDAADEVDRAQGSNAVLQFFSEKISAGFLNKTTRRNFLAGVLGGAAAVFGGAVLYEAGKKSPKGEKATNAEIVEKTGVDFAEIAEKHNFSLEMQVENGQGPYIIHIGQQHEHPTDKISSILSEGEVMEIQKDIENIVDDILKTKKASNRVFCEGVDDAVLANLKKIVGLREVIAKIKTVEQFNMLAEEALLEINDIFAYMYYRRLEELAVEFKKHPPKFGDESPSEALARDAGVAGFSQKEKFARNMAMVEERIKSASLARTHKDRIYIKGAQIKMFLDGKIDVLPVEDSKTHKKALAVAEKLQRLVDGDRKMTLEDRLKAEPEKMKKELEEIEREEAEFVSRGREDAAVKIISSQEGTGNLPLMIYGRKHDFSDAVKQHNKDNPGKKFGLIRINPILKNK